MLAEVADHSDYIILALPNCLITMTMRCFVLHGSYIFLMILSLGSNGSGQLALSHLQDVSIPTKVTGLAGTSQVQTIAAGGNHTLLLADGQIYASGNISNGRCNIPEKHTPPEQSLPQFQQTSSPVSGAWKLCSATWESSTFVSSQNEIFTCGIGNRGELGQGHDVEESNKPCKVSDFPPGGLEIVDLAACMSHTVAVLSNGHVYGWGSGKKGQIGSPPVDCWTPRMIDDVPFNATKAVCGRDFTYIVGSPESGQHIVLGADKWRVRSDAPSNVLNWKQIGASWGSIFVLLQDGSLLSWGRNDHGQLAPPGLPSVAQIATGSEHALVLTEAGKVLAWGWGEHGNCGEPTESNGDVKGHWNELSIRTQCISIGAGCATSWIVCKDV